MKWNPVLRKEWMRKDRSFANAALITVFVGIMAIFALLYYYVISQNVVYSGEVDFSVLLRPYQLSGILEFLLFLLLTPAAAAGSITRERERGTLDLLLTSNMTARQIVMGKFGAAISSVGMLFISSLPVLSLVFVYGGVQLWDFVFLLLNLYVPIMLVASISIFWSAWCKRTAVSLVLSYGAVAFLTVGTLALEWIVFGIRNLQTIGSALSKDVGAFIGLLTVNPAVTFFSVLEKQVGEEETVLKQMFKRFGMEANGFLAEHWMVVSIVVQLLLSALFLWLAVRILEPHYPRGKEEKKD